MCFESGSEELGGSSSGTLVKLPSAINHGCNYPKAWLGLGGAFLTTPGRLVLVSTGGFSSSPTGERVVYNMAAGAFPRASDSWDRTVKDTMSLTAQFLNYTIIFAVFCWWNRSALCIQCGRGQYMGENAKKEGSFGAILEAGDYKGYGGDIKVATYF